MNVEEMDEWVSRCMDGCMDGWLNERKMDEWVGAQMNG